jgi:hypothetical protein
MLRKEYKNYFLVKFSKGLHAQNANNKSKTSNFCSTLFFTQTKQTYLFQCQNCCKNILEVNK